LGAARPGEPVSAIREKAKKFQKFVKSLEGKHAQALPEKERPLLERFVYAVLAYDNPAPNAKKVIKAFTDEKVYGSWNEVRVSTVRELAEVLRENKIDDPDTWAPRLKQILQKVFEEADDTAFEPLKEALETASGEKQKKQLNEKTRNFLKDLPGIPAWGTVYLLTGLGLEKELPWEPYTEAVLDEQKVFPQKSNLVQKKRVAKALLEGLEDLDTLDVHHLLVEYGKKDLKKKPEPAAKR
jgi:endonuclease III